MRFFRIVPLLTLAAALALVACPKHPPTPGPEPQPPAETTTASVDVTSRITGRLGDRQIDLTVVGPAVHTQTGLQVVFTAKQLVAVDPEILGPLTVTLNPQRKSDGTLASARFPTKHQQSFFLQLEGGQMGTLVSDEPVVLAAEIDSSPPTATYYSQSGDVAFYRKGDEKKTTVFTIQKVTSEVKPAVSQAVDIRSVLRARVGDQTVNLNLAGSAVHLLSGRSVLFTAKRLVAAASEIGPVTVGLNPAHASTGMLSSPTLPADHTQNFFLQIHSERTGTLVSDEPLTLSAHIASSPPTATYRSDGRKVDFYRRGDPEKGTVLTVEDVESEVTPPTLTSVEVTSRLTARVADRQVDLTLVGVAAHVQVGRRVIFIVKQLVTPRPIDPLGPVTVTLDRRRESVGTLSSDTFPAEHRQSFFLRIESEQWGALVSDAPVVLSAEIDSSPPTATYQSQGSPVVFYKEGDRGKTPVLTVDRVTSQVQPADSQAVDVRSRLTANIVDQPDRRVDLTLTGRAVHLRSGRSVLFIAKRLVARDPDVGPITVTLNPRRQSVGTLASATFPTEHEQSFFLQIDNERWGSLVSDAPLTLKARIDCSPPTATYESVGGAVDFYRQGDPDRRPVLTVTQVVTEVTPPRLEPGAGE